MIKFLIVMANMLNLIDFLITKIAITLYGLGIERNGIVYRQTVEYGFEIVGCLKIFSVLTLLFILYFTYYKSERKPFLLTLFVHVTPLIISVFLGYVVLTNIIFLI